MEYQWFHAKEAWDIIMNKGSTMTDSYNWDWPRFQRSLDALVMVFPEEEGIFEAYKTEEEFLKEFPHGTFRIVED